jgi:hypothetical protein
VSEDIILWVDADNDIGDNGWDTFDDRYVNADGDTMSGPLAMGNQKITGLAAATAAGDAMSQSASDARYLGTAGGTLSGPLAMSSQKITGLGTPTATTDAVTKTYVDSLPSKATVSATAPSTPVVGQLWAQP